MVVPTAGGTGSTRHGQGGGEVVAGLGVHQAAGGGAEVELGLAHGEAFGGFQRDPQGAEGQAVGAVVRLNAGGQGDEGLGEGVAGFVDQAHDGVGGERFERLPFLEFVEDEHHPMAGQFEREQIGPVAIGQQAGLEDELAHRTQRDAVGQGAVAQGGQGGCVQGDLEGEGGGLVVGLFAGDQAGLGQGGTRDGDGVRADDRRAGQGA
jgi:hypothetical protein